jgi:hypothetical protein
MAAASYWNEEALLRTMDEEYLESQARDIDREVLRLQARIRGFLFRFHAGSVTRVPGHSFAGRGQVAKIQRLGCKVGVDGAYHDQSTSSDGGPEKNVDDDLGYAEAALDDPDFAEKKIDDLPDGWVAACTRDGNPFFVETETSNSSWTHPRQSDASLLFGADFSISWAWKQYFAHDKPRSSPSALRTPTIGELAVYFRAIEGRVESGYRPRWWRESDPSCPSQPLCEVCRHINFDALFHTVDAWRGTSAIPLGSLRSIANKTHCAFCRLVAKTASPGSGDLFRILDEGRTIIRCNLTPNEEFSQFSTRIRTVHLNLQFPKQENPQRSFGPGRIHQILRGKERPPEQKYNDSRLVKDQIDVGLVKSWLQLCERQHQSMLSEPGYIYPSLTPPEVTDIHNPSTGIKQPCQPVPLLDNSLELTTIDVQLRCLVNTEPDVRYIALSYVWGGPQPFQNTKTRGKELYTPGAVSAEDTAIPQTIRDAIKFVGMLGERYLWVDSLSIIQDSTREKMEQISNMGNIYSRAVLTLVAAHGDSCHAGLPGVRPGSRKTAQHAEQIEGMLLSNELRYMHEIVEDSIWNTRGWTYPERELSKRCLVFTEKLVYFSCNQMVCKEDSGLRNVSRWGEKHVRVRAERHPIWNNYRRAVKKFTKRTFTFDSDVINAFEGIVSLLQPAFKCDFLYGLPETELDVALLWQPKSAIRRRIDKSTGQPIFPSWSWAGWVGEIDYVWTQHLLDDLSRVQWQVQSTKKKEYLTSNQLRAPQSGQHGIWEYVLSTGKNDGGPSYYYQPEHPDIWCLHPTAAKEARLPRSLLLPGTHELRFKAQTAMLRIVVKPHIVVPVFYVPLSPCTHSRHICCPVEIISVDNFVAGTVYIPAHIMGTLTSEPREFVCLSRRRGYRGDTIGQEIYAKYQGCDTYPQPKDDFKEVPKHPTLYPGHYRIEWAQDKYDHSRYNQNKPWPLYNVMLIERKGNLAFRVATGIVHVTAFLEAGPVEKLIILA